MKYTIVLLMMIAGAVVCETFEVQPVADTYTIPGGGNFGSRNYMTIANRPAGGRPDRRAMLLWDLSEYMGGTVTTATLYINIFHQCGGAGIFTEFYNATQSWDESWSGAHVQHGTTPWQSHHYSGLGWTGVDVTDLVQAWLDGAIANHGVVLRVAGVYPCTRFYSRETAPHGHSPYLKLKFPLVLEHSSWGSIKAAN